MANVRMNAEAAASAGRIDRAKVDATTEQDIRRHMIEDGDDPDAPLGEFAVVWPAAAVRRLTGLSQRAFAEAIGVPLATLRNWEQSRTAPDPAARSLLALIADDPARALRVLAQRHRHA